MTKDFTKPTARGQTFIDGRSHHPQHVFKGVVIGEGIRFRRLNETEEGFQESLDNLEKKCLKSNFSHSMVKKTINELRKMKRRDVDDNDNKDTVKVNRNKNNPNTKNSINWITQFKNILKFSNKEKELVPNVGMTYCRPPTLKNMVTNYKSIASAGDTSLRTPGSYACKGCGLCGHHGPLTNMVLSTNTLNLPSGKIIRLRKALDCKDHGIYAARCRVCFNFYVGQTKNSFSTRWNSHRFNWRKIKSLVSQGGVDMSVKDDRWKEQNALFLHYQLNHRNIATQTLNLSEAYEVVFLEKPHPSKLDIRESWWISFLKANININKTCLPKYR